VRRSKVALLRGLGGCVCVREQEGMGGEGARARAQEHKSTRAQEHKSTRARE
jgi:hypothetical protein